MSEMVNAYALQELSLERRVRDDDGELVLNDYSEHTYEDAETILARYQPRSGLVAQLRVMRLPPRAPFLLQPKYC